MVLHYEMTDFEEEYEREVQIHRCTRGGIPQNSLLGYYKQLKLVLQSTKQRTIRTHYMVSLRN